MLDRDTRVDELKPGDVLGDARGDVILLAVRVEGRRTTISYLWLANGNIGSITHASSVRLHWSGSNILSR